jgi:hypothetical protein
MGKRAEQLDRIRTLLTQKKVGSLRGIAEDLGVGDRMVQFYLKDLQALTSYTHSGQFVTLPEIPKYDAYGIWFYRKIGFSNFGTSLDTIIGLIEQSKAGYSRDELEEILRIKISQQIQTLLLREELHRVKLGNRYLYLPEAVMKNKRKRLRVIGDIQAEEHFEKEVKKTDLIALLKAVLIEKKVGIEIEDVKRIAQKYALKIPLQRIQRLLADHILPEKKSPDTGR